MENPRKRANRLVKNNEMYQNRIVSLRKFRNKKKFANGFAYFRNLHISLRFLAYLAIAYSVAVFGLVFFHAPGRTQFIIWGMFGDLMGLLLGLARYVFRQRNAMRFLGMMAIAFLIISFAGVFEIGI